jgi:hypothetical protein
MEASYHWLMKAPNGPGPLTVGPLLGRKIPGLGSLGSGTSRHVGVTGRISMWESGSFRFGSARAIGRHEMAGWVDGYIASFFVERVSSSLFHPCLSIKPTLCQTVKAHSICV